MWYKKGGSHSWAYKVIEHNLTVLTIAKREKIVKSERVSLSLILRFGKLSNICKIYTFKYHSKGYHEGNQG